MGLAYKGNGGILKLIYYLPLNLIKYTEMLVFTISETGDNNNNCYKDNITE